MDPEPGEIGFPLPGGLLYRMFEGPSAGQALAAADSCLAMEALDACWTSATEDSCCAMQAVDSCWARELAGGSDDCSGGGRRPGKPLLPPPVAAAAERLGRMVKGLV